MKHFLLATLLLLGFVCEARPMAPRLFRHLPRKIERIRPPSWKQIAAGGVALGTVVGAYKVADGVLHIFSIFPLLTLPFLRLIMFGRSSEQVRKVRKVRGDSWIQQGV